MKTREYTNKILELVDEGVLDSERVMLQLLQWMSEKEVREFYYLYYGDEFEPADDED